jgi:hypothetical protein
LGWGSSGFTSPLARGISTAAEKGPEITAPIVGELQFRLEGHFGFWSVEIPIVSGVFVGCRVLLRARADWAVPQLVPRFKGYLVSPFQGGSAASPLLRRKNKRRLTPIAVAENLK